MAKLTIFSPEISRMFKIFTDLNPQFSMPIWFHNFSNKKSKISQFRRKLVKSGVLGFDEFYLGLGLPPLAPMTATLLFLALEVEKLLAMVAKGRWNLDIIFEFFLKNFQTFTFDTRPSDFSVNMETNTSTELLLHPILI